MRPTMLGMALAGLLAGAPDTFAAEGRRIVRCCVEIPTSDQTLLPWCFNIRARSRRAGRRICRSIGGRRPGPVGA